MKEGNSMIVYYTRTKNTPKMLAKLNMEIDCVSIQNYDGTNKFVLITPTYGIGEIPKEVDKFLQKHHNNMLGVISSGNRNWGFRFAIAGDLISKKYQVPLLAKYELNGYNEIKNLRKVIGEINGIH